MDFLLWEDESGPMGLGTVIGIHADYTGNDGPSYQISRYPVSLGRR